MIRRYVLAVFAVTWGFHVPLAVLGLPLHGPAGTLLYTWDWADP